ncbi:MAG: hypothetical protein HPY55_12395 [Firmicutes bacterium]|nr:hypothetical protein [Bacillota bacterium]
MSGIARAVSGGLVLNILRFFLCSAFVGLAVKIMDDWLDGGAGVARPASDKSNLAGNLGAASLPYAMLALVCGALFAPETAAGLFLCSYALGMAWGAGRDHYPSGLTGWQESALALLISLAGCGFRVTAVCGLCMAAVQGLDDAIDYRTLGPSSAPFARRLGLVETVLASSGILMLAFAVDLARTAGAVLGAVFVWVLEGFFNSRYWGFGEAE